ncbi:MAG TPA: diacylglycerol kinase family protein [Chthoniobacteraceae bacterium]|jgi:diacylglycerol kinase (ATP)
MPDPQPARIPVPRRGRLQSFVDAFRGLKVLLVTQPNARIHACATVAAFALGWVLRLSGGEWAAIVLAIVLVWLTEGLNTAIEFIVDIVSPEKQRLAGWAKDVAAGAVLLASIGAVVVGLLVFLPKLLARF